MSELFQGSIALRNPNAKSFVQDYFVSRLMGAVPDGKVIRGRLVYDAREHGLDTAKLHTALVGKGNIVMVGEMADTGRLLVAGRSLKMKAAFEKEHDPKAVIGGVDADGYSNAVVLKAITTSPKLNTYYGSQHLTLYGGYRTSDDMIVSNLKFWTGTYTLNQPTNAFTGDPFDGAIYEKPKTPTALTNGVASNWAYNNFEAWVFDIIDKPQTEVATLIGGLQQQLKALADAVATIKDKGLAQVQQLTIERDKAVAERDAAKQSALLTKEKADAAITENAANVAIIADLRQAIAAHQGTQHGFEQQVTALQQQIAALKADNALSELDSVVRDVRSASSAQIVRLCGVVGMSLEGVPNIESLTGAAIADCDNVSVFLAKARPKHALTLLRLFSIVKHVASHQAMPAERPVSEWIAATTGQQETAAVFAEHGISEEMFVLMDASRFSLLLDLSEDELSKLQAEYIRSREPVALLAWQGTTSSETA